MNNLKERLNEISNLNYDTFETEMDFNFDVLSELKSFNNEDKTMIVNIETITYRKDIEESLQLLSDDEWCEQANKWVEKNTYNTLNDFIKVNYDESLIESMPHELKWDLELCENFSISLYKDVENINKNIKIIDVDSKGMFTNNQIIHNLIFTIGII